MSKATEPDLTKRSVQLPKEKGLFQDDKICKIRMTKQIIIHVAIGSKNPCKIESVKGAFQKVFNNASSSNLDKNDAEKYQIVYTNHNVPSKVNDQPMGDDETLLGAKNRALGAFEAAKELYLDAIQNKEERKDEESNSAIDEGDNTQREAEERLQQIIACGMPAFGVGLEGGVEVYSTSCSQHMKEKDYDNNHDDDDDEKKTKKELWCMAWMAIVADYDTISNICTLCKHESSSFEANGINTMNSTEANKNDDKNEDTAGTDTGTGSNNNTSSSSLSTIKYKWGISKTASFKLPNRISHLVLEKKIELGHADDVLFNRVNSKHGSGTVGILTKSIITRSLYYDHALVLALSSFIWPEHYDDDDDDDDDGKELNIE